MPESSIRRLSFGCLFSDRIEALLDGRVAVEGFPLNLQITDAQSLFRQVLREAAFDVAELSMASHIAAIGRGVRDYVGVPAFLSRSFRHSNLYVRSDRIVRPENLAGRRIGIIDWQQTAALWVRGVLADQYGVAREGVEWITAGLHVPVTSDRTALDLPPGIRVRRSHRTLDDLLRSGEIDAIITPTAPRCFSENPGSIARMWPDPVAAETAYWATTGVFPIMHLLVVRRSIVEASPELPSHLLAAMEEARSLAANERDCRDFSKIMLPWSSTFAANVQARLGCDPWTYGMEKNCSVLELMLSYAKADGLTSDLVEVGALFK